jgi:signal transduction histidine kinase
VIADEIRRLDSVVQGFLRFSRPEELDITPVDPRTMCDEVLRVVDEEAAPRRRGWSTRSATCRRLPSTSP